MDPKAIEALLEAVRDRTTSVEGALAALRALPFEADAELTIDHHRALRTGLPEAVYGEGKSADQIARAMSAIAARGQPALATRVSLAQADEVARRVPEVRADALSRTLAIGQAAPIEGGPIAVVCAGTSDLPVAEEAAITLAIHGAAVQRVRDVGVAGLHRVLAHRATLEAARVVVVVAGMEGALPSVVAGLVRAPIVAVPTSVGYGASFGGVAALLGMLTSCAPGVAVVNIDNGFGAACVALRILRATA